jgi:hypothetical protein
MEQIRDGRRYVLIHPDAEPEDLPVTDPPDLLGVADADPFVPVNMDEPTLYPGDVIVGVSDDTIEFAELIYGRTDDSVLVLPLGQGYVEAVYEQEFSSRFFQVDEVHVYDGVAEDAEGQDVEFDASKVERPETRRSR